MSNKELYKETFDQMVMSEEAIRKVKDNMERKENRRNRTAFRVAVTTAALMGVFILGNIVSYAATGNSLVQTGLDSIHLFIDDKEVDVENMDNVEIHKDKDGNISYEIDVDEDEHSKIEFSASGLAENNLYADVDIDKNEIKIIGGEVKKIGDKIYFQYGKKKDRIDITEDFADGEAKGEFRLGGKTYQYDVTGTVEKYNIEIKK